LNQKHFAMMHESLELIPLKASLQNPASLKILLFSPNRFSVIQPIPFLSHKPSLAPLTIRNGLPYRNRFRAFPQKLNQPSH